MLHHAQEVEAVELRHAHIGDHRADGGVVVERIERLAHRHECRDAVAGDLEDGRKRVGHVAIIVDDEHRGPTGVGGRWLAERRHGARMLPARTPSVNVHPLDARSTNVKRVSFAARRDCYSAAMMSPLNSPSAQETLREFHGAIHGAKSLVAAGEMGPRVTMLVRYAATLLDSLDVMLLEAGVDPDAPELAAARQLRENFERLRQSFTAASLRRRAARVTSAHP